jgi:hypothetical protein
MLDTCAKVLNSQPRLKGIRKMDEEGLIAFVSSNHRIRCVAAKLTNNSQRLVGVEVRENLERFARSLHLELSLVSYVADLFDSGIVVLDDHGSSWLVVSCCWLELFHLMGA